MKNWLTRSKIDEAVKEYARIVTEEAPDELEHSESHIRVAKLIDDLVDSEYGEKAWWNK